MKKLFGIGHDKKDKDSQDKQHTNPVAIAATVTPATSTANSSASSRSSTSSTTTNSSSTKTYSLDGLLRITIEYISTDKKQKAKKLDDTAKAEINAYLVELRKQKLVFTTETVKNIHDLQALYDESVTLKGIQSGHSSKDNSPGYSTMPTTMPVGNNAASSSSTATTSSSYGPVSHLGLGSNYGNVFKNVVVPASAPAPSSGYGQMPTGALLLPNSSNVTADRRSASDKQSAPVTSYSNMPANAAEADADTQRSSTVSTHVSPSYSTMPPTSQYAQTNGDNKGAAPGYGMLPTGNKQGAAVAAAPGTLFADYTNLPVASAAATTAAATSTSAASSVAETTTPGYGKAPAKKSAVAASTTVIPASAGYGQLPGEMGPNGVKSTKKAY